MKIAEQAINITTELKMKSLIFLCVMIHLSEFAFTQNKDNNYFAFQFDSRWGLSNNPYPLKLQNANTNLYGLKYVTPLTTTYLKGGIFIKQYIALKGPWYLISSCGYGMDEYESISFYGSYDKNGSWTQSSITETISGNYVTLKFGIGKRFYLTKNKKLILIPESFIKYEGNIYRKIISDQYTSGKQYDQHYSGLFMNFSLQLNMSIQYHLFEKFGVGISFENLINVNDKYIEDEDHNPPIQKKEIIVGKNMLPPLIGIIIYL
jgi:hypothetical protein